MNNYIQLQIGGSWKRFRTMARDWTPVDNVQSTVRPTLLGTADVTFAPAAFKEWRGTVEAPVTPDDANWGSIANLRAALELRGALPFIDHYGTQYNVCLIGPEFVWRSLKPMWDAASNKFYLPVRIVRTA